VDLLEYQGKSLFARIGVPVPDGRVATSPTEAQRAAEEIGGRVVVKAQVQVGGRGKAGGIKLAETPHEAHDHALAILGMDIKGLKVEKVYVDYIGKDVRRDEPLLTVYSPELVSTQTEYLLALQNKAQLEKSPISATRAAAESLLAAARDRLRLWDVPEEHIKELEQAPPHAMTEIHRFFLDYKVLEEKEVVVDPFQGREYAIAVIRQALADYWTMRATEK